MSVLLYLLAACDEYIEGGNERRDFKGTAELRARNF